VLLVASGCGDGSGDSCTDQCEVLDEARCYGSVIEVCAEAEDGCNAWTAQTHCEDTGQFCDDSGEAPACVLECSDECSTEDETRCYGSVIESCTAGSDGCLDWTGGTDCGETGEFCDDAGTDAVCADECADECLPADATQCSGTVVQTCSVGSDGCTDWVDGTDCSDSGEECSESTGTAACLASCTDECDTEGATQCSTSDMVQNCLLESDGCTYWEDVYDCITTGYYCDDASGDAYCIRPCTDECDTLGATQCGGDLIQTCTEDTYDGCDYWVDGTDCSATGEVCSDGSGSASCMLPTVILLMGDDVSSTGWDEYRNALTAAGVTWDEWDLDTSGGFPTPTDLAAYDILIWFDEGTLGPGDADCQLVIDWLATGGKSFFATGVDFFWDLENGTPGAGEYDLYLLFATDYVGDYSGSGLGTIDGVSADPITDPFSTTGITLSGTSDSSGDHADPTTGLAVKAGIYGTGTGSGLGNAGFTYYDGSTYKTAWLGVNFHNGLSDTTQKNTLLDNILTFFGM